MEKKTTPKKSTTKKTQVKATKTNTQKKAQAKNKQVVTTQKKTANKNTQVVKTQKKTTQKKSLLNNQKHIKNANTGYLLGLTSLLAWVIPIVGTLITVSGIYCCYSGLKGRKSLALLGLIINVLFLGIALININVDLALMN